MRRKVPTEALDETQAALLLAALVDADREVTDAQEAVWITESRVATHEKRADKLRRALAVLRGDDEAQS